MEQCNSSRLKQLETVERLVSLCYALEVEEGGLNVGDMDHNHCGSSTGLG
jgi:hypothetical protein